MANFLEYRPNLMYKKELVAVFRDVLDIALDTDDSSSEIIPVTALQELLDRTANTTYKPSTAVLDAVDVTRLDALLYLAYAQQAVSQMADVFRTNLKSELTKLPGIEDYIKAREQSDYDTMFQFEDYHAGNLEGSTKAEVFPLLLNLQEEMLYLINLANEKLFAGSIDLQNFDEEELKSQEMQRISHIIELDKSLQLDTDALTTENHLVYFLQRRGEAVLDFVSWLSDGITQDVSDTTVNALTQSKSYEGTPSKYDVTASGLGLPSSSVELQVALSQQLQYANLMRFEKHAANSIDAKARMDRLMPLSYKKQLLGDWWTSQKTKLDNRLTAGWLQQVMPSNPFDELNFTVSEILDGVEKANSEASSLTKDLYRVIDLEKLQLEDYVTSVANKEQCRRIKAVLAELQES